MSSLWTVAAVVAVAGGICSHLFYFHHGEHHMYPQKYLKVFLVALAVLTYPIMVFRRLHWVDAVAISGSYAIIYLIGLFSSLLVYRIVFNPLNRFPGPYLARASKFAIAIGNTKSDGCRQILGLHQKYGKIVRIGPNDLSISDPDAVQVVLGSQSKTSKAPWYDQDLPFVSLQSTRSRAVHDRRLRLWASAFTPEALSGYEQRIERTNAELIEEIVKTLGEPINMSKWFQLYALDVMSSLAFAEPFKLLENGERPAVVSTLAEGLHPIALMLPPWAFRLLMVIPGQWSYYFGLVAYCSQHLAIRAEKTDTGSPDMISPLLEDFENSPDPQAKLPTLQADSKLMIEAGSATVAATLTHLFYHLAKDTDVLSKLRREIDPLVGKDARLEYKQIQNAVFLDAVINETLRLYPPMPSGVYRQTPPEGMNIGKDYVPGHTVIQIPSYVMARDETNYTDSEVFRPERWFSKPGLIKHKEAFIPFSIGPYACIGKDLAYMEIRMLTARLVRLFDVALAPGENGKRLLEETKDQFVMALADLDLVFTPRRRR